MDVAQRPNNRLAHADRPIRVGWIISFGQAAVDPGGLPLLARPLLRLVEGGDARLAWPPGRRRVPQGLPGVGTLGSQRLRTVDPP